MKRFLSLLFCLSVFASFGQHTGATYTNSKGQVLSKPVAINGPLPADHKSKYYDESLFAYRPFLSRTEALTYLGNQRYQGLKVWIDTVGTFNSNTGIISNGNPVEYVFGNDLQLRRYLPSATGGGGTTPDSVIVKTTDNANRLRYNQSTVLEKFHSTPAMAMKNLLTKLATISNDRPIIISVVGDSRSPGATNAAVSIAKQLGKSENYFIKGAAQATNQVQGWLSQNYSGVYSIRLAGNANSGAVPLFYDVEDVRKLVLLFGRETDGGTIQISFQKVGETTPTSVGSYNCQGATNYDSAHVELSFSQPTSGRVFITAPNAGTGYFVGAYVVKQNSGVVAWLTDLGGTALGMHSGRYIREYTPGQQYPSATPSGNLGLRNTFASDYLTVRPDAVLMNFYQNESADPIAFAIDVRKTAALITARGGVFIPFIEAIPYGNFYDPTLRAQWFQMRDSMYAIAADYPDNVFPYDQGEAYKADAGYYNNAFNGTADPGNPHENPGKGFGDPQLATANDLANKMGFLPYTIYEDVYSPRYATSYVQAREPYLASVGSEWIDTSNPKSPIKKVLISKQQGDGNGLNRYGMWEVKEGGRILVTGDEYFEQFNTSKNNSLGVATKIFDSQGDRVINSTDLVAGNIYTLSFWCTLNVDTSVNRNLRVFLRFINGSNSVIYNPVTEFFDANAGGVNQTIYNGIPVLWKLTFRMPTDAELQTLIGSSLRNLQITIDRQFPEAVRFWDFKIQEGASATNMARKVKAYVNSVSLVGLQQTAQPQVLPAKLIWTDTSNTVAIKKRLVEKNTIQVIGRNAANTLNVANSYWEANVPVENIYENYYATVSPDPGAPLNTKISTEVGQGFRLQNNNGGQYAFNQVTDVAHPFVQNNVYTLSFAIKMNLTSGERNQLYTAGLTFYIQDGTNAGEAYRLNLETGAWDMNYSSTYNDNIKIYGDGEFHRVAITFRIPNTMNFGKSKINISIPGAGVYGEVADLQLQQGASMAYAEGKKALPEYANNADALAGGLRPGDDYRTGDAKKSVY